MTDTIRVKVVVGGSVRDVQVAPGSTVRDAANEAGVSDELELRFRGQRASGSESLADGDTIVATPPSVKHG